MERRQKAGAGVLERPTSPDTPKKFYAYFFLPFEELNVHGLTLVIIINS